MFHNYAKCFLSIMNTFAQILNFITVHVVVSNRSHWWLKFTWNTSNNNLWTQINRHIYTQFTPPPSTSMKTDTSKYCVKYGWRHFYNKSIKIWQVVHKFVTRTTVISSHVCPDLSHFQCSDTAVSLLLVA